MTAMHLDFGVYTNVFCTEVSGDPVDICAASSSAYLDLRTLRQKITEEHWNVRSPE